MKTHEEGLNKVTVNVINFLLVYLIIYNEINRKPEPEFYQILLIYCYIIVQLCLVRFSKKIKCIMTDIMNQSTHTPEDYDQFVIARGFDLSVFLSETGVGAKLHFYLRVFQHCCCRPFMKNIINTSPASDCK